MPQDKSSTVATPTHALSRRVLGMEFLEGIKITDVDALRAAGVDPDQVVRILVETWCEQILAH